jgi:ketosteroid isomerase-like protein
MSQETIEIVRRAYEVYDRRDVEALQALCDEECIVYTVIEGRAEPQPFRGHDGIRAWIENENDVWESVTIDELDLRNVGEDRVFTYGVAVLRGRESGVELTLPVWSLVEVRNGKVFRLRSFPDRAEALEAAGLQE